MLGVRAVAEVGSAALRAASSGESGAVELRAASSGEAGAAMLVRAAPKTAARATNRTDAAASARAGRTASGADVHRRALQHPRPAPTDEYTISAPRPQTNGPTAPRRSGRAWPGRNVGPRRTRPPTTRWARTAAPRRRAKSTPTSISPRRGCAVAQGSWGRRRQELRAAGLRLDHRKPAGWRGN